MHKQYNKCDAAHGFLCMVVQGGVTITICCLTCASIQVKVSEKAARLMRASRVLVTGQMVEGVVKEVRTLFAAIILGPRRQLGMLPASAVDDHVSGIPVG